ncbi:hypothetical protein ZOSMA_537G00020 [Zostera marina]|uniref:Uncharacterized protein n=1 Tax=Zostera marina TaxID=29655 RepID=A0A0K9NXC1_ZOSMR|nr:hypothetical protein ZOSMA_537G00020 [Zostera marina]
MYICFDVWLYKHTMIAKQDEVYVEFEPYFKKWGGDVVVLRTSLTDLRPSEVFSNDIPLKKRMSLARDMEAQSSEEYNNTWMLWMMDQILAQDLIQVILMMRRKRK